MIIWFRHLPPSSINFLEWTPFIKNYWYRKHYMKFVYLLMVTIFLLPNFFSTGFSGLNVFLLIIIAIFVFILHECLHLLVIRNKGDISLTFSGIFFWINTNSILSKNRFWVFMSLPFIVLSIVPVIISFYVLGEIKLILLYVGWFNTLISSSDLINSFLIAIKPRNTVFCRGYYRIKPD